MRKRVTEFSKQASGCGGIAGLFLDRLSESENPAIVVVAHHEARRSPETKHPFWNVALNDRAGTYGCVGTYAMRADDLCMRSDPHSVADDRSPAVRRCADLGQVSDRAICSDPAAAHSNPPEVADVEPGTDVGRQLEPDIVRHPDAAAEQVVDRP